MKRANYQRALKSAVQAARAAGKIIRDNLGSTKTIASATQHDVKLELDVRCQKLIEKMLHQAFPDIALLGEEGVAGDPSAALRWVVDPIDGTVNFTYGIPHACISIALQVRTDARSAGYPDAYQSMLGVIYDPFCDELWTAVRGEAARLNGKVIRVSPRKKLAEAVVSIGFAKTRTSLERTLPYFSQMVHRVRKIRIMGSAALGLAYVANGRFDAYVEQGIRLWDIAAGGLIIECAGGEFWREPIPGAHAYRMVASNGLLGRKLRTQR